MRARLAGPPPDGPQPLERVLARLEEDVLPFRSRVDHPRFLAFIPAAPTKAALLFDMIVSCASISHRTVGVERSIATTRKWLSRDPA